MFTREQIREISRRLSELGVRDTDMVEADKVTPYDTVAIVQDNRNKKTSIRNIAKSIDGLVFIE